MAIKQCTKYNDKDLKMPCLYLNDIVEIQAIIQNKLSPSTFHIRANGYEFNDANELSEIVNNPTQIEIISYNPSMSIYLNKSNAYISIRLEDDEKQTLLFGVSREIYEKIIKNRERKKLYYGILYLKILSAVLLIFSFVYFIYIGKLFSLLSFYTLLPLFFLGYIPDKIINGKYSFFIPKNFKDHKNFFNRKKDEILLALLSASLGVLIGQIPWMLKMIG